MSVEISIQLSEQAYSSLAAAAVAEEAALAVEGLSTGRPASIRNADAADAEFEKCFGSVDLGHPIGIDNAQIDADLARAYETTGRC